MLTAYKFILSVFSFFKSDKFKKTWKELNLWQKIALIFAIVMVTIAVGANYYNSNHKKIFISITDGEKTIAGARIKKISGISETQETTDENGNAVFVIRKNINSIVIVVNKNGYKTINDQYNINESDIQKIEIQMKSNSTSAIINEPKDFIKLSNSKAIPVDIEFVGNNNERAYVSTKNMRLELGKKTKDITKLKNNIHRLTCDFDIYTDDLKAESYLFSVISNEVTASKNINFYKEFLFSNLESSSLIMPNRNNYTVENGSLFLKSSKSSYSSQVIAQALLNIEKPITVQTLAVLLDKNASIIFNIGNIYQISIGEKNGNIINIYKNQILSDPPIWIPSGEITLEDKIPTNLPINIKFTIDKIKNNTSPKISFNISFASSTDEKPIELIANGKLPFITKDYTHDIKIGLGAYLKSDKPKRSVRYDWLKALNSAI